MRQSVKISSRFPVILQTYFTRKALKGHPIGTPRRETLGHSKGTQGTWALRHLDT